MNRFDATNLEADEWTSEGMAAVRLKELPGNSVDRSNFTVHCRDCGRDMGFLGDGWYHLPEGWSTSNSYRSGPGATVYLTPHSKRRVRRGLTPAYRRGGGRPIIEFELPIRFKCPRCGLVQALTDKMWTALIPQN